MTQSVQTTGNLNHIGKLVVNYIGFAKKYIL